MVSLPFVVFIDTVAGTFSYVIDVSSAPIFFNTPNDTTTAVLSAGFDVVKSAIGGVAGISGQQGPSATVTGKTQITVVFAEDPGTNPAFKVAGFLQY